MYETGKNDFVAVLFRLIFVDFSCVFSLRIPDDETNQSFHPLPLPQVHIKSHFIMNGVCVRFKGWIDLERLDGVGSLEYDERRGAEEDIILREQIDRYNQRLRAFEDNKQRGYRPEDMDQVRRSASGVGVAASIWRR